VRDQPSGVPASGFSPMTELPLEQVIGAGSSTDDITCALEDFLTMADAIAIKNQEKSIWLVGFLIYDDVFDRECEQTFLYRLGRTEGTFIRIYDKNAFRTIV
jgi:hypothetical protein